MTSGTTSSTLTFTLYKSKKEKKGAENAVKDIIAKNFPNLGKEKNIQAQEVYKESQIRSTQRSPHQDTSKWQKLKINRESAKQQEKASHYKQGNSYMILEFSAEIFQARRDWPNIFKVMKEKKHTTKIIRIFYLIWLSFIIDENKDFTLVIEKALELKGYNEAQYFTGINGGHLITTGFGHNAVLSIADKIAEAVKKGIVQHIFLVGGCDGAKVGRNYYTDFVRQTPQNTLILTLACGKYRFNDLDLGEINGIPRLIDMGQCNDAYSAIKVAVELAKTFNCSVNDLPLSLIISWYEQKAVCILLTLLYLGIENIRLGPTLPAFISHNVLNILVEKFKIKVITTPEKDLEDILYQ